jgi:hypothetical protein
MLKPCVWLTIIQKYDCYTVSTGDYTSPILLCVKRNN